MNTNVKNFISSLILSFIFDYRPWVPLMAKYENFFNEEGEYIVRTKYQDEGLTNWILSGSVSLAKVWISLIQIL